MTYTVRLSGDVGYIKPMLRLKQTGGAGGSLPVMVPLTRRGLDAAGDTEFTGVLPVSAAHGPRLVPDAVIDPKAEIPGEVCMGSGRCDEPAPATGPTVTVAASHKPRLTVAMRPATIALPHRTSYPARSPKVRLDVKLVDSATGRPFTTRERLVAKVGFRTVNGWCRPDKNIPDLVIGRYGTTSRTVTTHPSTGARSSLDEAAHCAVLMGRAKHSDGMPSPRASLDDVMRFTTPVVVKAPNRWRPDRSIPVTATVNTYAAHGHVSMQVQKLHGRSAWRTVAVTRAKAVWNSESGNLGTVRIPAKGKGTGVYRVVATSSVGAMAPSTSAVFRVR